MSIRKNKGQQKKLRMMPVYILSALTAIAVFVMIAALCIPRQSDKSEFVPPAFDNAAVVGSPQVPNDLGYSSPYQDGMAYRFSVCGNVRIDGNKATVYLTNAAENKVYLKLRVLDTDGKILGETGLIKPGEYVKDVEMTVQPAVGTPIKLKIMSYEPETYNSMGSAVLNTQIGG